jgi:hypothetical protein
MVTQTARFKLALTHQNKILANYQSQLQQQQWLLDIMRSVLPDTLKSHARYCVIANRCVSVYTPSAVWASQLRFYTNTMLDAILKWRQYAYVEKVHIRILNAMPVVTAVFRQPKIPPMPIIKQIGAARSNQTDALGLALTNLSKTLEKKRSRQ